MSRMAIVFSVVAVAVLGFAVWGGTVLFAPVFGAGEAHKQIESATNRIDQYEHFLTLDKDIRSQAQNAATAQAQLDAFDKQYPPSATEAFTVTEQRGNLQAQVTGPRQLCAQNVAEYNNDAHAYTRAQFKDSNLPDSFDASVCSDPTKLPQGM